jgi:catechol 2,3-dioxygenase-like lactoylglutathione lyase family enzyme
MDYRLEVVVVPVSDVDRAKAFYTEQVGFTCDHDASPSDTVRVVQLTPPGSACSIAIGSGLTEAPPGSAKGLQLVVDDIEAARADLAGRGVEVSEVREMGRPGRPGFQFVFFGDPDGNGWAVQELPRPSAPTGADA